MASGRSMAAMKMTRMKSFVKKWQSLAKVGKVHTYGTSCSFLHDHADGEHQDHDQEAESSFYARIDHDASSMAAAAQTHAHALGAAVPEGFTVVLVGKALRQYAIHARHLQHPLFQALQQRSETSGISQSQGPSLGCEVVLFEHLLWMLDSDDPALYTDSIQELVELYMPSDGSSLLHDD